MRDQPDRRSRRRSRASITGAALAFMVVIAACGGGDDDAGDTTSSSSSSSTTSTSAEETTTTTAPELNREVCDLVTVLDITAALHVTVEPGVASGTEVESMCAYATADDSTTVVLTRHEPVGELLADTLAGDPKAEVYPGILEEAVIQLEAGIITVRVKDIGLVIETSPPGDETALVQLARVGAGKMVTG